MKVMIDTNILLDVFQQRHPHYRSSAECLNLAIKGHFEGVIPAHALTTFYYVIQKHCNRQTACDAIQWLLQRFQAAACDHTILLEASQCGMNDFEDAVVAISAMHGDCTHLLTRNPNDFLASPVTVISPEKLLATVGK